MKSIDRSRVAHAQAWSARLKIFCLVGETPIAHMQHQGTYSRVARAVDTFIARFACLVRCGLKCMFPVKAGSAHTTRRGTLRRAGARGTELTRIGSVFILVGRSLASITRRAALAQGEVASTAKQAFLCALVRLETTWLARAAG